MKSKAKNIRKKQDRELTEKILSTIQKKPTLRGIVTGESNKLNLSLEEVIDTETGEVMNNEQFLEVLKQLKPNQNGISKEKRKNSEGQKKYFARFRK